MTQTWQRAECEGTKEIDQTLQATLVGQRIICCCDDAQENHTHTERMRTYKLLLKKINYLLPHQGGQQRRHHGIQLGKDPRGIHNRRGGCGFGKVRFPQ